MESGVITLQDIFTLDQSGEIGMTNAPFATPSTIRKFTRGDNNRATQPSSSSSPILFACRRTVVPTPAAVSTRNSSMSLRAPIMPRPIPVAET